MFQLHSGMAAASLSAAVKLLFCVPAAVAFCGMLGARLPRVRFRQVSESESLMNFSVHGALHCVCDGRHAGLYTADRRQSCRACGHCIASFEAQMLERRQSPREIAALTKLLRSAGERARNREIPREVTNVYELHAYLDANPGRRGRKPPRRPNARMGVVERALRLTAG